jgi:transcriptional regulator with XRE-family HTH domain
MTKSETNLDDATRLAQRLREAREFANLSQQFVAEQTGIPRSAISDIEHGARKVESLELKRFAELYRMPLSYFLGDDEGDGLASAPKDTVIMALTRAASDLSDEEKAEVLRFALFLQRFERRDRTEQ